MASIKTALISVSDKTGIVEFASILRDFNVDIISTGRTALTLRKAGIKVTEVSDYTSSPEMLDGRVKTLHPKIYSGILARRDVPEHMKAIKQANIPPIDLVVVNLYPFIETVAKSECTLSEALENIDIGGPTMIRGAAKNYQDVAVVTDPKDYAAIGAEFKKGEGIISDKTCFSLAKKAFMHTAGYDAAISDYLTQIAADAGKEEIKKISFPQNLGMEFVKVEDLRYGENPHQQAAFYREAEAVEGSLSNFKQIQGKELSYNNIADSDAAWECVKTFSAPACVIVKHANPCGVAVAENTLTAYQRAYATDPVSAFGGIIAFNRELYPAAAQEIVKQFVEVVIAPVISPATAKIFAKKPNIRLLQVDMGEGNNDYDFRRIGGGLLVQTPDTFNISPSQLRIVTKALPTPLQMEDLVFAWRVAKFVKSNAIVFAAKGQTLGIGAGQSSRVDSTRIATIKAQNVGLSLTGSAVASDAFFPFRDGLDVVAKAGARAVIQPGGSLRDEEVIAAADEQGLAMVFTGIRHFRHS